MNSFIEEALAVEPERGNYESIRHCAGEYHSRITGIILDHGRGEGFSDVWNETVTALPPDRRLLFVYMDWIEEILSDGLTTTLLNADAQAIRFLREMVELSQSAFLKEKIDEALALFTQKYEFRDDENYWSLHPDEETTKYFDEADMGRIEEIGDEIDNWDAEDIDRAFQRLSNSTT